jgi:hypothetical protein
VDKSSAPNKCRMGDPMIIGPHIFDLLFYSIVLVAGIDFVLSGWLALSRGIEILQRPRLLGLLLLRIFHRVYESYNKSNRLLQRMYSFNYMRFYIFLSGVLIIISSILLIFSILT